MRMPIGILTALSLLAPTLASAARYGVYTRPTERVYGRHLQSKVRRIVATQMTRPDRPLPNFAMKTFVSPDGTFQIGYPANWQVMEGFMGTVVSFLSPLVNSADTLTENVNIMVQPLEDELSLAEASYAALAELKQTENFRLLESMPIVVDKARAHAVIYTGSAEPVLKFKQAWTIHDGSFYVFTFASSVDSYRNYVRIFDRMVSTIHFQ